MPDKKRLTILGSTGSIGTQTLDIVRHNPKPFSVAGLAANSDSGLFIRQVREFRPQAVYLGPGLMQKELLAALGRFNLVIFDGPDGLADLARMPGCDMVVNALVGALGLAPTLAAIESGRDVALANKETLVAGGELVMRAVKKHDTRLLPIDSEHAALHQCLDGRDPATVRRLLLTASGGPFRSHSHAQLRGVKASHALQHPTWSMGQKVTIDSATLMNKGLEMIEAHHLFAAEPETIEVVVHPESIIHSMVEFVDGSIIAQLSTPDMRLPIQYAITYPRRVPSLAKRCDLAAVGKMTFHHPDRMTFRCLDLAYQAIGDGGTMPAAMNAANEVAVRAFLEDRIGFLKIPELIERVMRKHDNRSHPDLGDIQRADRDARLHAEQLLKKT